MSEKKYITASEISEYTFCPRAWALKKLDYEQKNQREMEAGKEHHKEVGQKEIEKSIELQPELEKRNHQIQAMIIMIIIVILFLFSVIIRIILK